jgi:predicted MPP superfamily phosphohydrolase
MQSSPLFILFVLLLPVIDLYMFKGIKAAFKKRKFIQKKWFINTYWITSVILTGGLLISVYLHLGVGIRAAFLLLFFLTLVFKLCFLLFIVIDDIRRGIIYLSRKKVSHPIETEVKPDAIPRSDFLMKAGLLAGIVPLAAMKYSMAKGLYDYQIKKVKLYLPNLPKAFDGIRIGQLSDIHSGSFYNKTAVFGGVEMLLKEKADVIFFTGDLVNRESWELRGYQDIFSKVKAPLGVYSTLGNHDYGDYADWKSAAAKKKNFNDLVTAHRLMGWDLLIDQNRRLKVDGEEIGILGIGNWGELSHFPKYGRIDLAVKNTDDLPVKLLLSHDPSHWQAQVLPHYPQIDAMFSGHTHGMQFGVRTNNFQWSPVEYIYKEWAGLYRQDQQQLYVNVGYGFLGYPGRIGILPEITIFELKAGTDPSLKA